MRLVRGLVLAGGLILGLANQAPAQFSMSIGNPYTGQGISINTPVVGGYGYGNGIAPGYGYGSGYSGYNGYSSGYSGYGSGYSAYNGYGPGLGYVNNYQSYATTGYVAGPGVIGYSSGYAGVNPYAANLARPYPGVYGLGNPGYGYGYGYANGLRPGFGPIRAFNRVNPFRY